MKNFLLILIFLPQLARANTLLSLEQFLQKVANHNTGIKALHQDELAAEAEKGQALLLTATETFAEATHALDQSPILTPAFNGSSRSQDEYKIGLRKQWAFGLKSEAYLVHTKQSIDNAVGLLDPSLTIRNQGLRLGFELPLIKNGLGRDIKLKQTALDAAASAGQGLALFQRTRQLIEAQKVYIRLAHAHESLKIQVELVAQGKKLVDWVKGQVRDRLLEAVHLSIAQVAFEARKLGQSQKEIELRLLVDQMNSLLENQDRGAISTQKLYQLDSIIKAPARLGDRGDLKARQQYLLADSSQLTLNREMTRPDLNLKAQFADYQKLSELDDTRRCKNYSACSALAVTLAFSMPLSGQAKSQMDRGLLARIQSKEADLERSSMDAKLESELIQNQVLGLNQQMQILNRLIDARERRLGHERERQERGRASTFDLIQAEQELFEAKEQLLKVQSGRLELISQLGLYEAQP